MAEKASNSDKSERLVHPNGIPAFGDVLNAFRTGYTMRVGQENPELFGLDLYLTADGLRKRLEKEQFSLTGSSFNLILHSQTLPREALRFVAAFSRALIQEKWQL